MQHTDPPRLVGQFDNEISGHVTWYCLKCDVDMKVDSVITVSNVPFEVIICPTCGRVETVNL